MSAAGNPEPVDNPGVADEAPQPITDEEARAIGDLGNEGDDCGLLRQARAAHRELHLDPITRFLRDWERRRRGKLMD